MLDELELYRSQVAALEQLLEVFEQSSLEQSQKLEAALRERDDLLTLERAARAEADAARARTEMLAAEREAILSQIADGVIIADPHGSVVFANATAAALYPEVAARGTVRETFGTINAPAARMLADALAGTRRVDSEWELAAPSGGPARHVHGSAVPVYDHGVLIAAVLTLQDVTQRKELERAIEHERNRLSEVLMQAPAAIAVMTGPDHVITTVNEFYVRFTGRDDAIGRPMREVFPEIEDQGILALFDQAYRTGESYVGLEQHVRFDRDGNGSLEDGYFNFVLQPLRDANGAVYGLMSHSVEVTDLVLARQEVERKADELLRLTVALSESNRELDQFAYVTSHDLKAPLRGIANLAQWIQEDVGDALSGESREHMQLLQGRVQRMEALIDGILAYSRASRSRSRPERIEVREVVAEVLELLAPPADVTVEVAPDLPVIYAERIPFQQVMLNLVSNALKHGRADAPVVTIGFEEAPGETVFFVADNGAGIAPEFHERIWGIFQTLEARDKVEGTGIGLAVVKKIVESRGGCTWVESTPGAGSKFLFAWPKHTAEN